MPIHGVTDIGWSASVMSGMRLRDLPIHSFPAEAVHVAGTLTENRMTVVAGWFAGQFHPSPPALEDLPKELQSAVQINSAMNSKVCARVTRRPCTVPVPLPL